MRARLWATLILSIATVPAYASGVNGNPVPDLFPAALIGPQKVHVGTQVPIQIMVGNLGGSLVGDYTAEVLLTADQVIDVDDTVVASITTPFLGQLSLLATIPSEMDFGLYQWALRILPAKGEIHVANNQVIGLGVQVIKVDLALQDPAPIVVFSRLNDPASTVTHPEVVVENVGTPGNILVFKAVAQTPAPWLSFDPPENFSVAGEVPNSTTLVIDKAGLPIGSYQTVVRFFNIFDPADFEDLTLTFVVGEPKFVTGDRVQGQVSMAGEVDEILFDGLEGMKVPFEVKTGNGALKTRLTLIDPFGQEETVLTYKPSVKYLKQIVKLKHTGEYRLLISGKGDTIGNYKIRTKRKMPKAAKPHNDDLLNGDEARVLALEGALLDAAASPNAKFQGPLTLLLRNPTGDFVDTTGHLSQEPGAVLVKGLELTESGEYTIEVLGYGPDEKALVEVSIQPVQPKMQKKKIYLD